MRRITLNVSDEAMDTIHRVTEKYDISQAELIGIVFAEGFELDDLQQMRVDAIKIAKFTKRKTPAAALRALKGMSIDQAIETLEKTK